MVPSPGFENLPLPDVSVWQEAERQALALHPFSDLEIHDIELKHGENLVPVRTYRSVAGRPDRVVIWFHGGAFVMGGLQMPEAHVVAGELASRTSALVISVDYKLVDDNTRFPCAQKDALSALGFALEQATNFGLTSRDLFIGGASAGACLAGSLSLMARDREISIGGVMPIYPIAHQFLPEFSSELIENLKGIFYFDHEFSKKHNPWLIGNLDESECETWHCFPGDSSNLSGQSDFLVLQAQRDSLRASGDQWVQQLRSAGIGVTEFTFAGAEHGFLNRSPKFDRDADLALSMMAKFVSGEGFTSVP